MIHAWNFRLRRQRQEYQEFKVILSNTISLRPTGLPDSLLQKNNKITRRWLNQVLSPGPTGVNAPQAFTWKHRSHVKAGCTLSSDLTYKHVYTHMYTHVHRNKYLNKVQKKLNILKDPSPLKSAVKGRRRVSAVKSTDCSGRGPSTPMGLTTISHSKCPDIYAGKTPNKNK